MKETIKKFFRSSEKRWVLPVISGVFVVLIPVITTVTVMANRRMGAYSSEADTIIIPVIHSVTIAMLFFIYLLLLNLLVLLNFRSDDAVINVKSKLWLAAGIIFTLPGVAVCLLMILYWLSINHLPVIIVYLYGIYVMLRLMLPLINRVSLFRREE